MKQFKTYHKINQTIFFITTKQKLGLFCQKEHHGNDVWHACFEVCYHVELWSILISKYFGTFLVDFTKVSHLHRV
jgi:hypothetical protein